MSPVKLGEVEASSSYPSDVEEDGKAGRAVQLIAALENPTKRNDEVDVDGATERVEAAAVLLEMRLISPKGFSVQSPKK